MAFAGIEALSHLGCGGFSPLEGNGTPWDGPKVAISGCQFPDRSAAGCPGPMSEEIDSRLTPKLAPPQE